ncbi:hypothetical protein BH18THE1_BH18THE1_21930 [soil metagenome]
MIIFETPRLMGNSIFDYSKGYNQLNEVHDEIMDTGNPDQLRR